MGVGTRLIEAGLTELKQVGVDLVFVLGHPGYYPRCGFTPAGVLGFEAPYPIPEKNAAAWMVQDLSGAAIGKVSGKVGCAAALDRPAYWRE
jgi:predicted N-acetyltransferase YhbS